MKKILLVLLAIVLVGVAIAACKSEVAPLSPTATEEAEFQWPRIMIVSTMSSSSDSYALDVGWSTPLGDDTGMTIRLLSEDSSQKRYQVVKDNEAFTTCFFSDKDMLEARGDWATRNGGPFPVRIAYTTSASWYGHAVRGDSGIKTPYDLKEGTRWVAMVGGGLTTELFVRAACAWGKVNFDGLVFVPVSSFAAIQQAVMDGRADFALGFPTSPTWYEAESAPHGLDWIQYDAKTDPEGAMRFQEIFPVFGFGPCQMGVPTASGKWMIQQISPYVTLEDAPVDLVYNFVKWMDENYNRYKGATAAAATTTLANLVELSKVSFVPFHEGTIKYLREKGLWTEENDKRNEQNIELLNKYIAAYQEAIDKADSQGIDVTPQNKAWLDLWTNYKKELKLPEFKYLAD